MQNFRLYVITAIAVLATPVVAVHSYTQTLLNKPKVVSQVILPTSSSLRTLSSVSIGSSSADNLFSTQPSSQSSSSAIIAIVSSSSLESAKVIEKPKESSKIPEKKVEKLEIPAQILEVKKESVPVVVKAVVSSSLVQVAAPVASSSAVIVESPVVQALSSSSSSVAPPAPKPEISVPAATVVKPLTFAQQIDSRCEILGCNAVQMKRVMTCESGGNASAYNAAGPYVGLFQFLPATFKSYSSARYANVPNASVYSGEDQILVASWMFANGYSSQWGCK